MKFRATALRLLISLFASHLLACSHLFAQEGRLIITSDVPRASVYLENNLVASTDDKGSLVIDQLPEGIFHMELRKEGYRTFRAQVRIESGQKAVLNAKLASYEKEAGKKDAKTVAANKTGKAKEKPRRPPAKKSNEEETKKFTLVNPQEQKATSPEPRPSAETKVAERAVLPSHPRALGLYIVGVLLLFGIYWIIKIARPNSTVNTQTAENAEEARYSSEPQNGPMENELPSGIASYTEDTQPREEKPESVRALKKGFIKALRRKEELWQAGLIAENKQKPLPEAPRKPEEVIIDLSKEHYRYDEEKGERH